MNYLKHIHDLTMTQISELLELLYQSPEKLESELTKYLNEQLEDLRKY